MIINRYMNIINKEWTFANDIKPRVPKSTHVIDAVTKCWPGSPVIEVSNVQEHYCASLGGRKLSGSCEEGGNIGRYR